MGYLRNTMNNKKVIIEIPHKIEAALKVVEGYLITNAKIDGKTRPFIIDSGGTSIILNARYVDPDKLSEEEEFQGASGKGTLSKYFLKKFEWHGLVVKNKVVGVIDLSHAEKDFGQPFYGLIGSEQLAYFTFYINHRKQHITLWRKFPKEDFNITGEIPFVLQNHLPVIETLVNGRRLKLGLDTGAGALLLDSRHKRLFKNKLVIKKTGQHKGADNKGQTMEEAVVDSLTFNSFEWKKMKVALTDLSHLTYFGDLDGILGVEFFKQRKMAISIPAKKIYLLK